jgi:hypothetical protein
VEGPEERVLSVKNYPVKKITCKKGPREWVEGLEREEKKNAL